MAREIIPTPPGEPPTTETLGDVFSCWWYFTQKTAAVIMQDIQLSMEHTRLTSMIANIKCGKVYCPSSELLVMNAERRKIELQRRQFRHDLTYSFQSHIQATANVIKSLPHSIRSKK